MLFGSMAVRQVFCLHLQHLEIDEASTPVIIEACHTEQKNLFFSIKTIGIDK